MQAIERSAIVLLLALATLVAMVWGISTQGWYLVELGALFLALAVLAGLVGGLGASGTARSFGEGASELAITALLIAGWSYAYYSFSIGEKSLQSPFGPIIWPLKMVIPAAAFLLLLQGISQVIKCVRCLQRGFWQ